MKAPNAYTIHPYVGFIRDAASTRPNDKELTKRFRDAMVVFRTRLELLASLNHETTEDEAASMTLMLETLIKGKQRLQADNINMYGDK